MRPNSAEIDCKVAQLEGVATSELIIRPCGVFKECSGCRELKGERREVVALRKMAHRVGIKIAESNLA